ncbi:MULTISPECIES: DUF1524 domain-containing protein [unclassified Acinetobacter]|uniref:GmrSD restriction endonuclease domain-containing protein n=1 Tax=unclassified Acinetobacter TaxID=196816 RepID=UPI0034DB6F2B
MRCRKSSKLLHKLGNLTLISESNNSQAQNFNFKIKARIFKTYLLKKTLQML